jgi:chemotaxis protein MotB
MSRRKHTEEEEGGGQERWLLTYADLITLLLGLFVILYAMSKIDMKKYDQVVVALGGVFGSGDGVTPVKLKLTELQEGLPDVISERTRVENEIRRVLQLDMNKLPVSVSQDERGVVVHIQEELLFPSGSADLKTTSLETLDKLAGVFRTMPNDIRVEGHTDNVPIASKSFPSNWHLSVGRALNVGYYLIQKHRLNPEKISVVGYSEYRPIALNNTAEDRAKNRRVDIVVVTGTVGESKSNAPISERAPQDTAKEK